MCTCTYTYTYTCMHGGPNPNPNPNPDPDPDPNPNPNPNPNLRPVPAELDARVERDAEPGRPRRAPERGGRVAAERAAAKDGREGDSG